MSDAGIVRRDLLFLAVLAVLQTSNAAAEIANIPEVAVAQRPNCTISQSIVDFAEKSGDLGILNGAVQECDDAITALDAIQKNGDRRKISVGELRYLKGLDDLIGGTPSIQNMGDFAAVMSKIIGQNKDVLNKMIQHPQEVADDEVIQLFKNLAAISLLNAALVKYPFRAA